MRQRPLINKRRGDFQPAGVYWDEALAAALSVDAEFSQQPLNPLECALLLHGALFQVGVALRGDDTHRSQRT